LGWARLTQQATISGSWDIERTKQQNKSLGQLNWVYTQPVSYW
jgi:hypothetical protein